jgi:hypothetical protein
MMDSKFIKYNTRSRKIDAHCETLSSPVADCLDMNMDIFQYQGFSKQSLCWNSLWVLSISLHRYHMSQCCLDIRLPWDILSRVTVQRLWAGRQEFDSRQKSSDLSLLHSDQTVFVTPPASYPMGTGGSLKRPRRETDHSPPSSAEAKNGGAIPPLLHMSSWCSS